MSMTSGEFVQEVTAGGLSQEELDALCVTCQSDDDADTSEEEVPSLDDLLYRARRARAFAGGAASQPPTLLKEIPQVAEVERSFFGRKSGLSIEIADGSSFPAEEPCSSSSRISNKISDDASSSSKLEQVSTPSQWGITIEQVATPQRARWAPGSAQMHLSSDPGCA